MLSGSREPARDQANFRCQFPAEAGRPLCQWACKGLIMWKFSTVNDAFSRPKIDFLPEFSLTAGNSDIRNASADRGPQYLLDVVDAGRQHDEAIEPERDPGAGGQPVLEGGEEVLVDRIGLAVELPLLRLV